MVRRLLLPLFACALASAQTAPWTATLRASWVQTGAAKPGDLVLASKDQVAQIVVGDSENEAVHQAAAFLAGDIEKISGHRPEIVKTPAADRVTGNSLRLR